MLCLYFDGRWIPLCQNGNGGIRFSASPKRCPVFPKWPGIDPRIVIILGMLLQHLGYAEVAPTSVQDSPWHYGAYVDLSYPANFNSGDTHPWRSKATTYRLSEFSPNMGMLYIKKEASQDSRWGLEFGGQAGYDTDLQLPATSRLPGADILRYFSRANISYLAPVGNGLTLTGGLINSFIGFESMYAKDNPNYTRSWIADYSPYSLIGAGGQYPLNETMDVGAYVVSDFNYLSHVNNHPKYAGQLTWRITPNFKLTQNVFFGPEQTDTSLKYWRAFSDTLLQWSGVDYTVALAYDVGTEQSAGPSHVQVFWNGAALFTRWQVSGPWAIALRPELYWDPNGTLTGSIQFIKAVTATVEYTLTEGLFKSRLRA